MATATRPVPGNRQKARKARDRGATLAGLTLDELFAEARAAYAHLPSARRKRVIARIVRRHVLARLQRPAYAGDQR